MPPSKKRKTSKPATMEDTVPQKPVSETRLSQNEAEASSAKDTDQQSTPAEAEPRSSAQAAAAQKTQERLAKFKELQVRAKKSSETNFKAAAAETARLKVDPTQLTSLSRKHAFASHALLKADTLAAGEDFERKRAWDWTVEESEKWDRRVEKKGKHRAEVAFADYTQEAAKMYKKQLREMKPDTEAYEKAKVAAVQRAAVSGGLELVETEDGEIVAVDKEGRFYSTADSTEFVDSKPDRQAVDRLVADLRKAEEQRFKKRRERGREDDGGDVSYINEANKQFNMKLARFYNKYTAEIRDSFERGTMI